jgi:hypothetical protein
MRRALALFLAVTLAAALPATARPSDAGAPCAAVASASGTDCCGSAPAVVECPITDCAGAGAALPVAVPDLGHAVRTSDSPGTAVARLISPPTRAPDTAPPKPVV